MNEPMISIIAGIGKNRELGNDNNLLWNIPEDMKWFREKTNGHPVIMGRKTHESINRILPNRPNIIITKNPLYKIPGATVLSSLDEAIDYAMTLDDSEIFIIGGASIYAQAIGKADKLYLTLIDEFFNADAFFPEYSHLFKTVISQRHSNNDTYHYTFIELTC